MLVNIVYGVFSSLIVFALGGDIQTAAVSFVVTFIVCCLIDTISKRGENGKDVQGE